MIERHEVSQRFNTQRLIIFESLDYIGHFIVFIKLIIYFDFYSKPAYWAEV